MLLGLQMPKLPAVTFPALPSPAMFTCVLCSAPKEEAARANIPSNPTGDASAPEQSPGGDAQAELRCRYPLFKGT